MWLIATIFIIIILAFIFRAAYSKASILTIFIWTNNNKYGVQYKPIKPEINSNEWVWLCVLIPARMLFKISNIKELTSDPDRIKSCLSEGELIKNSLHLLGTRDWQNELDIKKITNSNIMVNEASLQGERFRFSLNFLGKEVRSVLLPFSPCESHFHNMWLAILITSLNYMTDKEKKVLRVAFNEMHEKYLQCGSDSLEASHEIPRKGLIKGLESI